MINNKERDKFSEEEAERRFDTALRGAFITPHQSMKDIPRKRRRPSAAERPDSPATNPRAVDPTHVRSNKR